MFAFILIIMSLIAVNLILTNFPIPLHSTLLFDILKELSNKHFLCHADVINWVTFSEIVEISINLGGEFLTGDSQ